jgi:hypothetical protein
MLYCFTRAVCGFPPASHNLSFRSLLLLPIYILFPDHLPLFSRILNPRFPAHHTFPPWPELSPPQTSRLCPLQRLLPAIGPDSLSAILRA